MNLKNNILPACLALMAVLFAGCRKFLDVNHNPAVPQEVSAELYLSPIIYHIANGYAQDQRFINKFTQAMLGASTGRTSYIWEQHSYPGGTSDLGAVQWRTVYFNHGANLENMISDAIAKQKYEFAAIGYAIKAWDFQTLTDYHGPLPIEGLYHPTKLIYDYHDQPYIYEKVQRFCDTALFYLAMESPLDQAPLLAKYDYIYFGSMARWKKFVHGIKALNYSRYINKPDFVEKYADSVLKYVALSFETISDDACVNFTGTRSENSNVYGQDQGLLNSINYNRPGKPIVSYLTGGLRGDPADEPKTSDDPRLSRMLKHYGPDSLYLGAEPDGRAGNSNLASVGSYYLFKNKADFPILTYHQLQFIKAEVALKKADKQTALLAYRAGIAGHMNFVNKYNSVPDENLPILPLPITAAEVDSFMTKSAEVVRNPNDLTLADIMGHKYIALWGWGGYDIWADLRKYRYDPAVFRQFVPLGARRLLLPCPAEVQFGVHVERRIAGQIRWAGGRLRDPTAVVCLGWVLIWI